MREHAISSQPQLDADIPADPAPQSGMNRVPVRSESGISEPYRPLIHRGNLATALPLIVAIGWVATSVWLSDFNLGALAEGMPRLLGWLAKAWPPNLSEMEWVLYRALQTLAIATAATAIAAILAFPLGILAARNVSRYRVISLPVRMILNVLRGIDTIIFALIFVVAVGLGPFAGALGMILHSIGVIGKLNSEAIETLHRGPIDAARISGANGAKVASFAVFPSAMPLLTSTAVYMWEGNVRTSTVLGLVGAGGIGMEIKNSIDLLNFPRLLTLTVVMLIMVAAIDWFSGWLRQKLV